MLRRDAVRLGLAADRRDHREGNRDGRPADRAVLSKAVSPKDSPQLVESTAVRPDASRERAEALTASKAAALGALPEVEEEAVVRHEAQPVAAAVLQPVAVAVPDVPPAAEAEQAALLEEAVAAGQDARQVAEALPVLPEGRWLLVLVGIGRRGLRQDDRALFERGRSRRMSEHERRNNRAGEQQSGLRHRSLSPRSWRNQPMRTLRHKNDSSLPNAHGGFMIA